ncbi:MAG: ankyrin repeat domain-containing protein [Epsilonproteobacteria bacterium]|nr:ankyrin repeat domain-containing protein [Campylobacterota bacterium]
MHLLIQNGADVNAKNNMGMTPLMHYAFKGDDKLVKILLENGANINAKSEMTAFDLASDDKIKEMIQSKKNNHPQKLVKLLSNFTIDKPIKYTTHEWDFGELQKEYGNFEGYMSAIKKQFDDMKNELETLSPNLCKKVYTFLLETEPSNEYSWCSKTQINLGWSSLKGLKEWCDSGKNPFAFKLPKAIFIGRKQIATFGEVITLFKGEIEVRTDTKAFNLESIFSNAFVNFKVDYSTSKLATRQFYTDTQKFSAVLSQIAKQMHMREDCNSLEVSSMELEDRSIEIKLTQIGSYATQNSQGMLEEVKDGDFADIKANLTNLCDWSIESGFESEYFRINYLHSNNVKEIVLLSEKPKGFTHIFRFYR